MSHPLRAAAWMSGAIVSFSSMAVAGRAVSLDLDTFEIMLYRSIVGFLIVVSVSKVTGHLSEVTSRSLGIHLIRNVAHFTGQNLWFFALTLVPLAQLFALEFTTPVWVVLLAPLILGERLTRVRMAAAALGFIGILLVARPSPETLNWGVVAAAASALGFAGSILATKFLTRTETLTCILFWMTLMQIVFGLVCAGIDGDIAVPAASSLPWVIVIGFAGLMAHFCITTALSLAPATFVMPFDFFRLPVIAVVGMLFYDEQLHALVILGAAVIFGANYLNVWAENRRRRLPQEPGRA